MIMDAHAQFAFKLAHDGTTTELDLDTVRPGPGQPIKCFIQGNGLVAATGFTIDHGDATGVLTTLETHATTDILSGLVEFELPSNIKRFVEVNLTGTTSAGTWTAGVVLPGNQTNV